jgi:hypothetical protein
VVDGIWKGEIVFWDSLTVNSTKKPHIFNARLDTQKSLCMSNRCNLQCIQSEESGISMGGIGFIISVCIPDSSD